MPETILRAVFLADTAGAQAKLAGVNAQINDIATSGTNKLGKFGAAGALAFAAIGVAAVAGIGKAIKAASDLEEAQNKTNEVFRKSAEAVEHFAESSSGIGVARTEALSAASAFGSMFNALHINDQAASDMSIKLVQVAADMASFNNVDPSDMLDKLRSGLAGMPRPLREMGVFISDDRVKAEALAMGIAALDEKLTDAQKIQARYNIILKDTARQQGDFNRTLGSSAANQLRVFHAEMANASEEVGQSFLPAALTALKVVNMLATAFNTIPGPVRAGVLLVAALGGSFIALGLAIGVARKSLAGFTGQIPGAVAETRALAAANTQAAAATTLLTKGIGVAALAYGAYRGYQEAVLISHGKFTEALGVVTTTWGQLTGNVQLANIAGQDAKRVAELQTEAIGKLTMQLTTGKTTVAQMTAELRAQKGVVSDATYKQLEADVNGAIAAFLKAKPAVEGVTEAVKDAEFALVGMSGKDLRKWSNGTIGNLNLVSGSMDDLAGKAHLTANKIINAFTRHGRAMADYKTNWETLLARGLPETMLKQLQDMGEGGANIVSVLAHTNDAKFNQIMNRWTRAQGVAKTTSRTIEDVGISVTNLPNGKLIKINADISQFEEQMARVRSDVNAIHNMTVNVGGFSGATAGQFGFEGVVRRPTYFLAGEHGAQEHVSITPQGHAASRGGGTGASGISLVINVAGSVTVDDLKKVIRETAVDAFMPLLRRR